MKSTAEWVSAAEQIGCRRRLLVPRAAGNPGIHHHCVPASRVLGGLVEKNSSTRDADFVMIQYCKNSRAANLSCLSTYLYVHQKLYSDACRGIVSKCRFNAWHCTLCCIHKAIWCINIQTKHTLVWRKDQSGRWLGGTAKGHKLVSFRIWNRLQLIQHNYHFWKHFIVSIQEYFLGLYFGISCVFVRITYVVDFSFPLVAS